MSAPTELEKIREALDVYDVWRTECPVFRNDPKSLVSCTRCGATASQNCGAEVSAAYVFIRAVRAAVGGNP